MKDGTARMDQLPLDVSLADHAEFATFVPARNAAVLAAVRRHALAWQNPVLWIWGPYAVGKTHLLHAAVRSAETAAVYINARDSVRQPPDQIGELGGGSLVAIDDLHCFAGATDWEHALFALFNRLEEGGGALLVAATGGPYAISFGLPDLASRLSSGPVFQLLPLSDEERIDALRVRASARGLVLPDETGQFLLQRYPRDMRSLYAALERLDAASMVAQRRLTVPFVRQVLGAK